MSTGACLESSADGSTGVSAVDVGCELLSHFSVAGSQVRFSRLFLAAREIQLGPRAVTCGSTSVPGEKVPTCIGENELGHFVCRGGGYRRSKSGSLCNTALRAPSLSKWWRGCIQFGADEQVYTIDHNTVNGSGQAWDDGAERSRDTSGRVSKQVIANPRNATLTQVATMAEVESTAGDVGNRGLLGPPSEGVQRYEDGLSGLGVRAEKMAGGVNTAFEEDVGVQCKGSVLRGGWA